MFPNNCTSMVIILFKCYEYSTCSSITLELKVMNEMNNSIVSECY